MTKQRILVLGGGMGGMTAAHELTRTPELRERFDLTVVQMGWRLGGKGASGRGPHDRVEEHGLHLFFGIYEHAFRLLREVYAELDRPPSSPIRNVEQAFTPLDHVSMMQQWRGQWLPWTFQFPANGKQPGAIEDRPWRWFVGLLEWLRDQLLSEQPAPAPPRHHDLLPGLSDLVGAARDVVHTAERTVGGQLLAAAARLADELDPDEPDVRALFAVVDHFGRWLQRAAEALSRESLPLFRLYLILDLGLAVVRGFLADALWRPGGFARIDAEDYRAWLRRHGASAATIASPLVLNFYTGTFTQGPGLDGTIAAGTALRIQLKLFFAYQGSILYRFNAGMGDVIFAPLYQALHRRGVHFKFFHRVVAVELDAAATRVERVRLAVQAELVDPSGDYRPLREVKHLPVWPDQPDWSQLKDGEQFKQQGVDFESYYDAPPPVGEVVLEKGRDFDDVVLAIPPAAWPFIAPDLVARAPAFKTTWERVRTIQTQSLQLWLRPDWRALGWTDGSPSIAAFADPLGTIADLANIATLESWPQGHVPGSILYLCGYLDGPQPARTPPDPAFPAAEAARVEAISRDYVANQLGRIFPAAREPGDPNGLAWSALIDPEGRTGPARLQAQYWRANVEPSERYTLAAAGTNKYRMRSGATGLDNLVAAGDWTDNTIYIGSAEGATISGIDAAATLRARPFEPAPPPRRERVAVLGGGIGGLTAAWALSSTPELRARYEVTVYTMGWRLGGKGASGRGDHGRIEEHGVHMFFGFYDNAFAIMRELYPQLRRPAGSPQATWQDAFHEQPDVFVFQPNNGGLIPWHNVYPRRPGAPGEPHPPASLWSAIKELVDRGLQWLESAPALARTANTADPEPVHPPWWQRLLGEVESGVARLESSFGAHLMRLLRGLLAAMPEDWLQHRAEQHHAIIHLLDRILRWLWEAIGDRVENDVEAYRIWVAFDWIAATLRGLLRDGLLVKNGWRKVDDVDYRDWLRKHGASERTIACPLVHSYYSAVLAGSTHPQVAVGAGTALHTLYRIFFTYHGTFLYRMSAGMGDTVMVPFYKVLSERGVRFEFFQQITDVVPEAGAVARIELARQVDLKDPARGYAPLQTVADLDTWPAEPLYDQLVQGDALRAADVNLESYYAQWQPVGASTLQRGRDFDQVVFAIPVGAVAFIAPSLVRALPRWQRMSERVQTIQTQSFQLWLTRDLAGLGWAAPSTFATTYVEPVDTWSDMSLLLPRETWPNGNEPKGIAYFTGFMDGPAKAPPLSDTGFPAAQTALARAQMTRYVERELGTLWPQGADPTRPGALAWTALYDLDGRAGAARLDAQFWKANFDPWDRYVLSAPNTNQYRIGDDTDLDNLAVAGDWTDNGFYSGAAEGAFISGLLAARKLSGVKFPILGVDAW
jgi:uncharacterized protein with NAD-binding domain and iron-sulfur cluster